MNPRYDIIIVWYEGHGFEMFEENGEVQDDEDRKHIGLLLAEASKRIILN